MNQFEKITPINKPERPEETQDTPNIGSENLESAEKKQTGNRENKTPEEILKELAQSCEPYMGAPLEAVSDGTFAGNGKLKIDEDGNVVLIRHAEYDGHLIQDGKEATPEELRTSSEFRGGAPDAGAVHTAADVENWKHQYDGYPIYGIFKIPVDEFLELGRQGKIIIGNLGETEIVISGDIAERYLTEIYDKKTKTTRKVEKGDSLK